MRRRDFIATAAAAGGAANRAFGQSKPDPAKLERIAIMTLCFSSILKTPAHPDDPARTIDLMDLPQIIADRYGVHNVEPQHTHFLSTEPAYLKEFRARVAKAKCRINQINLEFGPLNISATDPMLVIETIDLTKQWINHAADVGSARVMLNQGTLAPEVRKSATAALKTIGEYGKSKKVFVTLENRQGPPPPPVPGQPPRVGTAGWEVLVEVIKEAGIWANPDVGNFPDNAARAAGLRAMYPLSSGSSHCHYAPERYSEADAIKISKEVGYKGLYSVEAGRNNGPDPYAAVQNILDELLKDI